MLNSFVSNNTITKSLNPTVAGNNIKKSPNTKNILEQDKYKLCSV
jgi:hypothetical protein